MRGHIPDSAPSHRLPALLLILPLGLFLAFNFLFPIGVMLSRAVLEREVPAAWPNTAAALSDWRGERLPDSGVVARFAEELRRSREDGTLSAAANRLNYDIGGFRSLLRHTAAALPLPPDRPPLEALIAIDARWGEAETWNAIKRACGPLTSFYLLASLDLRLAAAGRVVSVPDDRALFLDVFARTFWIGTVVTLACLVLGYPLAYLLATRPAHIAYPLLILVLLPFWTSILVRTTAWVVLLQRNGVVNDLLQWLQLVSAPVDLIYNRVGVYVAMTHVLLPFLVLPLYGVMKGISRDGMRAAASLGAPPLLAFRKTYVPHTIPGVIAGSLIVFMLALGYYVTPALVGGPDDQMIAYFVASYTNQSLNWGMAAALSVLLLLATLLLIGLYRSLVGARIRAWG